MKKRLCLVLCTILSSILVVCPHILACAAISDVVSATGEVRTLEHIHPDTHRHKPVPSYAKWGQIAVLEASKRYPTASVVDYLHIGRKDVSSTEAEESFKLWLQDANKEFGVIVTIQFNTATERVVKKSVSVVGR